MIKRLAGESPKPFRLRAVLDLLKQQTEGLDYEALRDKFNRTYPDMRISKETIVRDLKLLVQREEVYSEPHEDDNRCLLWFAYAED